MNDRRPKIQLHLAFPEEERSETPRASGEGTESFAARKSSEFPAFPERLMEKICETNNLVTALRRVKSNRGSPGADGMTVRDLEDHLRQHWPMIRDQLLQGTYHPRPVKRVEIPKPDGGVRKLRIPTVLDRFIQQALLQVLQRDWDRTFSGSSYGFRPGRSAHQAITVAQGCIAEGYRWVVDLDLEKFFDRVNHDILMSRIAKRVRDVRVSPLVTALTSVLWFQLRRRAALYPSGETELAGTRDTQLPWMATPACLCRTLATPPLCSAARRTTTFESNQNSARKKKAAPRPWRLRQRPGTATLVISNLLIPTASNVLFPLPSESAGAR